MLKNDLSQPNTHKVAQLFNDIRGLIDQARNDVARAVNVTLVLLNWHIGQRIHQEILGKERADYGKYIVEKIRFCEQNLKF
jgi:hypothetical protein